MNVVMHHIKRALGAVKDILPEDILTVHEYGFRHGASLDHLNNIFPRVKGFDVSGDALLSAPEMIPVGVKNIIYADEVADLIIALHVVECSGEDPHEIFDAVLPLCRYMLLGIHPPVDTGYGCYDDWRGYISDRIIYEETFKEMPGRAVAEDTIVLLEGDLEDPVPIPFSNA